MGIAYCDELFKISAESIAQVEKGMVFNVRVGLKSVTKDSENGTEGQQAAILIADTVLVVDQASVLTEKCTTKFSEISYELGSGESESEEKPQKKKYKEEKYVIASFLMFVCFGLTLAQARLRGGAGLFALQGREIARHRERRPHAP